MSPTCRQDMTFRRDWRRQGGCRRHSGGCRVSAAVGKPRTYVGKVGMVVEDDARGQGPCPPVSLRAFESSPSETGTRVAWKKTLPEDADEVSVATRAGKLALRSLFSSMDADAGDDDSLLTMLDAAGGGSSDCGEETDVENETPGADFSSIRDDDGTASVYSGMDKQALGFLLAQSSRAKE
ncbi:hypothetical protein THAOC_16922 [Thalassiosira oceanica]|uniref:Uncharacterized protein n=1 Tax=Thalassiosira oceanica TaxID=159749 RepID=K0S8G8_THAOC|nr:hypothetical protein THAOC_16922 [Thalassiosira oceanica]|eukprot:EJK62468.1 hypothetical protein THAOC_16922 [Thalassiosira oceanica]